MRAQITPIVKLNSVHTDLNTRHPEHFIYWIVNIILLFQNEPIQRHSMNTK